MKKLKTLPTSNINSPPPNTQKTKKEAAKAKNFNMTERILIFDLTDINQIIHVCIISIKFN